MQLKQHALPSNRTYAKAQMTIYLEGYVTTQTDHRDSLREAERGLGWHGKGVLAHSLVSVCWVVLASSQGHSHSHFRWSLLRSPGPEASRMLNSGVHTQCQLVLQDTPLLRLSSSERTMWIPVHPQPRSSSSPLSHLTPVSPW